MPDFAIVPAVAEDIDAVKRLEDSAFPSPWRREFFESEVRAGGRYNRVAKNAKGELLGYIFSMYFLDELHVNKIAVQEAHRRHGVARALMADCVRFAREHGVTSISLEVRASNYGAQSFYRLLKFAPVYTRPNYYPDGEAAVVMTAEI